MFNHQKTNSGSRARRPANRPLATRMRMGLVMRKGMVFGGMGDVETALRMQGVSLAPISTGAASVTVGGVMVLPTATADDITSGRLKGLVVPGGVADAAEEKQACALIELARQHNLPVIGFGGGVALGAAVSGQAVESEGAVFANDGVTPLNEPSELIGLVDKIAA